MRESSRLGMWRRASVFVAAVWITAGVSAFPAGGSQAVEDLPWVKGLSSPMPAPSGSPGAWFPWNNQYNVVRSTFAHGGITAAEGQAWDAQLRAICDVLKATPVLSAPAGFYPELTGHIAVLDAGSFVDRPRQAPLVGGISLAAWPPRDVRVDAAGAVKLVRGAHIQHFRLELNYIYPPARIDWMKDAAGEFAPLVTQGEFAGFPLHGNSLVLTRDGRLPFAPVSQKRALEAFIADREKYVASVEVPLVAQRKKEYEDFVSPEGRERRRAAIEAEVAGVHPTAAEQTRRRAEAIDRRREQDLLAAARQGPSAAAKALDEAKARLAAFGEAERQAPAWLLPSRGQRALEIVAARPPGASPLVAFDEGFFDPKQPRHTLRVALVRELHNIVDAAQGGTPSDQINLQVLQQVNWRAFADRFLK